MRVLLSPLKQDTTKALLQLGMLLEDNQVY